MKTPICESLGIDVPVFAFSHCRNVVAEVCKAGGIGVFGAVGYTPEQLKHELDWLDQEVGGRPYGIDVIMPVKDFAEGIDNLEELIPDEHRAWVETVMRRYGIPDLPETDDEGAAYHGITCLLYTSPSPRDA